MTFPLLLIAFILPFYLLLNIIYHFKDKIWRLECVLLVFLALIFYITCINIAIPKQIKQIYSKLSFLLWDYLLHSHAHLLHVAIFVKALNDSRISKAGHEEVDVTGGFPSFLSDQFFG